ncbi:Uncharacterized conserved protein [Oligella ureolytica]|uniref:hypothetical protein n=1 Tax=Oligella ureolytica TaxID=90244 RepID=UPI000DFCC4F9|nr:hypothetical protein [Oligella ureolytica]SUA51218.1 Uncharacterized conserved protein [Oligella ureolytica]
MGCNAWNHPPNCSCGWGGVWYSSNNDGSDSWLFNKQSRERRLGTQTGTLKSIAVGYTNPNAVCPVCFEQVYYYESPYGGKVYFDELGPPWPKHPCTSNEGSSSFTGVSSSIPREKPWHLNDWLPLVDVKLSSYYSKNSCLYSIEGLSEKTKIQLYFRATDLPYADIVRYQKTLQRGVFNLSMLYYDPPTLAWHVVNVNAYTSDTKAIEEGQTAIFLKVHGKKHSYSDINKKEDYGQLDDLKGLVCPWCDRRQKNNLASHLLERHGLVALGETNKITGFLRVRDFTEEENNRLKQILEPTINLFNGDKNDAIEWIYSHHKKLGKYRPISLIYHDNQVDKVLNFIKSLLDEKYNE